MTVCPWCDDPNSPDYDCHQHCKCVCHAPDDWNDPLPNEE